MSDSDDLMPSNVYTFQNESTAVCAKGPNINNTNITGLSFRNNVLSSTLNMPRNFDRQRYPEHSFDQRSMAYRRETSPMSMYSDMRPRNFQHSYYHSGMSSQRSMYNGRSGSPMSMRSMDSNASVSAADIASAFKNVKFNKYDLRMIKEAYNKFVKRRVRKRIEKRRNMRLFLKGYRRKSGYDSGDLGSDSSISSDDCRSTHSAMYKDNMSSCRSTRTDIMDFRRSIKESNMYKDCTNSLKNSAFRNIYSVPSSSTSMHHRSNNQTTSQNPPVFNQKERFHNGFLLPSQRFNKSVASVPIPETQRIQNKPSSKNCRNNAAVNQKANFIDEIESDQEEIFSEITVRENNTEYQQSIVGKKRTIELQENECSDKKRTKLSSSAKKTVNSAAKKIRNILKEDNNNTKHESNPKVVSDFEFLKPQFPVRKVSSSKFKEKLISKSAAPLTDAILPPLNVPKSVKNQIPEEPPIASPNSKKNTDISVEEQSETMPHSNSNMSMRPSFIKRKLFSQKMDVTEKKNLSTEAININSPQTNVYSDIQREKHKARKVVTNQSCLNRDIAQEDTNLLDLIHKIVPPDRMNATNVSNKTNSKLSLGSVKHNDDDKWDVTSVISMCNNDDVSDTYTDEEIFNDKKNKKGKKEKPKESPLKVNDCKVVFERSVDIKASAQSNTQISKPLTPKNVVDNNKKSVYNCVKSFWDTDFESDLETPGPKRWADLNENQNKTVLQQINQDMLHNHSANASVTHNTTSLSESLKYKTNNSLLDNTTSKLKKYNINRNLTIKAFRTPKIKMTEKKIDNYEEDTPPRDHKNINKKTVKQNCGLKTKTTENKKSAEKKINMNAAKEIEKKKQTTISKPKIIKSTENKIQNNNRKLPEHQNNVKDTIEKTKIANEAPKIDANVTVTKSLRISKKKVCCSDHKNTEKHIKSPVQEKEHKNKILNKSKSLKSTATSKNNMAHKKNVKTKQSPENSKKIQNIQVPKADEEEQIIRTLRTRKIDLSSSINTSNENFTNITFRSLRTRKINLSSSINDSTLEGNLTVVTKKIQRTPAKKALPGKTIQNETKKGRLGKKNVKG